MVFVGREAEQSQLEEAFRKKQAQVLVLYGREGVGKTTLAKEFAKDKPTTYYLARELSKREQYLHFQDAFVDALEKAEQGPMCFIIDEFHLMLKGNKDFFHEFTYSEVKDNMMILFISSQIQWVENKMVEEMHSFAMEINNLIKVKEFGYSQCKEYFSSLHREEVLGIYGMFGGVPGYWACFRKSYNLRDNILNLCCQNEGVLRREAGRFLKTHLREMPFYNTILAVLAEDEHQMQYLYDRTNFNRAKITVYIKNLIQMDVAEKIFSFEPKRHDLVKKGMYGIKDAFLHFWYQMIFPYESFLCWMEPEDFYREYLEDKLFALYQKGFHKAVEEYLLQLRKNGGFLSGFSVPETFYGKTETIPYVLRDGDGNVIVVDVYWGDREYGYEDFVQFSERVEILGMPIRGFYLFSRRGFTFELIRAVEGMENIRMIPLGEM